MYDPKQPVSRRTFLGLSGLALSGMLGACGGSEQDAIPLAPAGPRSLDDIKDARYLRVALISDNRPLAYTGGWGTYTGLDQYFCFYFTDKTWIDVDYVIVDPRDRYDVLLSGEADVCASEMSPLDARADEVLLTHPLYTLQLAVISPAEAPITAEEQLDQTTLIVAEGSYAEQYAAATWPEVPLHVCSTISAARSALVAGEGGALLDEEVPMVHWLKDHGNFTMGMRQVGEPRKMCLAVAGGQEELLDYLNDKVEMYITNGWSRTAFDQLVLNDVGSEYSGMLCKLETAD